MHEMVGDTNLIYAHQHLRVQVNASKPRLIHFNFIQLSVEGKARGHYFKTFSCQGENERTCGFSIEYNVLN